MKLASSGGCLGEELAGLCQPLRPDPSSELGEHVNDCWPGPADRSLVHWLRRLVARRGWTSGSRRASSTSRSTCSVRLPRAAAIAATSRSAACARALLGPGWRTPAAHTPYYAETRRVSARQSVQGVYTCVRRPCSPPPASRGRGSPCPRRRRAAPPSWRSGMRPSSRPSPTATLRSQRAASARRTGGLPAPRHGRRPRHPPRCSPARGEAERPPPRPDPPTV